MTALEILALIFAIWVIIKISILLIAPKGFLKFSERVLKNINLLTVIYLVIAIIFGYFIFQSLSIIEVAATMMFTAALVGLGFVPLFKYMNVSRFYSDIIKEGIFVKFWLSVIIWLFIAFLVLYKILLF